MKNNMHFSLVSPRWDLLNIGNHEMNSPYEVHMLIYSAEQILKIIPASVSAFMSARDILTEHALPNRFTVVNEFKHYICRFAHDLDIHYSAGVSSDVGGGVMSSSSIIFFISSS